MVKLDASTGLRADTMLYSIANGANSKGSLEGGWVFKRCGYYYLFSSWGACCSGAYDYNIRVGRSTTVTGPYVDKAGTDLMKGGGTLLVAGKHELGRPRPQRRHHLQQQDLQHLSRAQGELERRRHPAHLRDRLGRRTAGP